MQRQCFGRVRLEVDEAQQVEARLKGNLAGSQPGFERVSTNRNHRCPGAFSGAGPGRGPDPTAAPRRHAMTSAAPVDAVMVMDIDCFESMADGVSGF